MRRDISWRRRTTVVAALGAIVAAGALGTQAAAAPQGRECPNGFVGTAPASDFGETGTDVDKNGDLQVCWKRTGNPDGNIIDNKIIVP
jgi:hypothetical protein